MTLGSLKIRKPDPKQRPLVIATEPAYSRSALSETLTGNPNSRAWIVSLVLHAGILVVLASMTYVVSQDFQLPVLSSILEEIEPDREFETVMQADSIGNHSDMQTFASSSAAAKLSGDNPRTNFEQPLEEINEADFQLPEVIESPSFAEFTDRLDLKGEVSDMVGGVEGALDRLVAEIRQSLEERKTLVVWLFDASGSLVKRRTAIADRFENIYEQLGQLKQDDDPILKTVIATFGETHTILTDKPVDDVRELVQKIRDIKMDNSGRENVFAAIQAVTRKFYKYRLRAGYNVMVVVVTDERGDDEALLDTVSQFNRRYGIQCYCIGNASTFGRELGYVTWTYPDGATKDFPVHQGPETAMAERLRLGFWAGASAGGGNSINQRISSGHGPYALTRLCGETGGLFLITEDTSGPKFDHAVMRSYHPDYFSRSEYERRLKGNQAKFVLVQSAALTRNEREGSIRVPRTAFRADRDAILRQQMTEAQKPMAKLTYQLDQLLSLLEKGEQDREKLTEPRWRAGYDLAMGRTLAMKVRSLGYNSVLAEMKSDPRKFTDEKNDQWALVASEKIISGATIKKLAEKARVYLKRVIDEHPDTPWGLLAERELSQPLGWKWVERSIGYAQIDRRRQTAQSRPRSEQEQQKRQKQERDGPKGL